MNYGRVPSKKRESSKPRQTTPERNRSNSLEKQHKYSREGRHQSPIINRQEPQDSYPKRGETSHRSTYESSYGKRKIHSVGNQSPERFSESPDRRRFDESESQKGDREMFSDRESPIDRGRSGSSKDSGYRRNSPDSARDESPDKYRRRSPSPDKYRRRSPSLDKSGRRSPSPQRYRQESPRNERRPPDSPGGRYQRRDSQVIFWDTVNCSTHYSKV